MTGFSHGPVQQIDTTASDVYAFSVTGHLDDDSEDALAKFMNDVFDHIEKVKMLLDLSKFTGSDWDAVLDKDVIESRFRSLKHVSRYAVIGAPERAAKIIDFMDKIMPVEAKVFSADKAGAPWDIDHRHRKQSSQ